MYNKESYKNIDIYYFNNISLKIKIVKEQQKLKVFVNYKGYNPLTSMIFGNFKDECDMDSLKFEVEDIDGYKENSLYFVIDKENEEEFIKVIYFFIREEMVNFSFDEIYKIGDIFDF